MKKMQNNYADGARLETPHSLAITGLIPNAHAGGFHLDVHMSGALSKLHARSDSTNVREGEPPGLVGLSNTIDSLHCRSHVFLSRPELAPVGNMPP